MVNFEKYLSEQESTNESVGAVASKIKSLQSQIKKDMDSVFNNFTEGDSNSFNKSIQNINKNLKETERMFNSLYK